MEKKLFKSFLNVLLLLAPILLYETSYASASSPTQLYNQGNQAYQKSEYGKAFELYEQAVNQGSTDPDLYYNMGNASYKTGKPGFAILYYSKALRIAPSDKKIAENLKFVKLGLKDKIVEPEKGVITGILGWCFRLTSLNGFFITALIPYLILAVMLFFVISGKQYLKKPVVLFSSLFLVASLFFFAKVYDEQLSDPKGVVVSEEIKARSEPKNDGEAVFTIHEGTSFEINEDNGEWVLITLPTGWSGWVNRSGIEII